MATYKELRDEFGNTELQHRIQVAIIIAANAILTGADTTAPYDQTAGQHGLRVKWAAAVIQSTEGQAAYVFKLMLGANAGLTIVQIRGASDAAIQSNVGAVIDALATAQFGG